MALWTATVDIGAGGQNASATDRNLYIGATGNLQYLYDNRVQKIAESVLGAPAASVTFSSIPGTYRHLGIRWTAVGSTVANSIDVVLQANGDTGANYDSMLTLFNSGGLNSSQENLAQASAKCGYMPASTGAGAGGGYIEIPFYAGTTLQKMFTALAGFKNANTTASIFSVVVTGHWRSAAAITSILLKPSAGNFITGSTFVLYGLN